MSERLVDETATQWSGAWHSFLPMSVLVAPALKIIAAAGAVTVGGFLFPLSAHAEDPCTGDSDCSTFGHLVCDQIDGGLSSGQVAQNAMIAYNLDMDRAAWLVSGAIVRYCPWG